MSAFDVTSPDGTRIRGWTNDGTGPAVLLCNGLGAPAVSWPLLAPADAGFRVVSWDYRGLGGSERPRDPRRIAVGDHLADALAVADAAGLESFAVLAWSIGVNVAFELVARCPSRVTGVLAVAGVPGGTFSAMFGPLRGGARARHAAAVGVAKALRAAGPALGRAARAAPLNRATAAVLRHSGALHPAARPEYLLPTVAEFRAHDFRWYFTLAVAMADHRPMASRSSAARSRWPAAGATCSCRGTTSNAPPPASRTRGSSCCRARTSCRSSGRSRSRHCSAS